MAAGEMGCKLLRSALALVPPLAALAGVAGAQVEVSLPAQSAPGAAIAVVASVAVSPPPQSVELLYRSAAAPEVQVVAMARLGGTAYRAEVPGMHVVAPGVEVVVRVIDPAGGEQLFVREAPDQPYVVAVTEGSAAPAAEPAPIESLDPEPGSVVIGRHPRLVARLRGDAPAPVPGLISLTIDGIDLSAELRIEGHEIQLQPRSALAPGAHEAILSVLAEDGQSVSSASWPFSLRDYASLEEGSVGLAGSGSYEQATQKLLATDPRWRASGEVRLEGSLAERALRASEDFAVRYVKQGPGEPQTGGPDFELSSHLLGVEYAGREAPTRFEFGDIGIRETPLTTGASFARRGTQLGGSFAGTRFHAFAADAIPLFGFTNFTGLQKSDQRVQGGSLARDFFDDQLRVQATALTGRTLPLNSLTPGVLNPTIPGQPAQTPLEAYDVGSSDGGFDAQTYSLALGSSFLGGSLRAEAEGAWARRLLFAPNSSNPVKDVRGWQDDPAWRARIEGDAFGVTAGLEYQRTGPNFASAANPTLVSDRSDALLDLQTSNGPAAFSLRIARGNDDVDRHADTPRTTEWRVEPGVSLSVAGYPALSLTYLRSGQTVSDPLVGLPDQVVTQGISLAVSYTSTYWYASVIPSYQSQLARNPDARTSFESMTLAGGFTPTLWLSISPSYTWIGAHDSTADSFTQSHVPTLTAHVELVPELLDFDTQASYSSTHDNRHTIDTAFVSGLGQLSLSLKRYCPGGLAPSLGLRARYERSIDHLQPAFDSRHWGVFLYVDLFAPLQLLPELALGGSTGAPPFRLGGAGGVAF